MQSHCWVAQQAWDNLRDQLLILSLTPGFPLLSVGQGTGPFAEEGVVFCFAAHSQEPKQLSGCCRRQGRAVGQGLGRTVAQEIFASCKEEVLSAE